ncbi:MAG: hypothetical protein ING66_12110 [Rhodocyclaceae bacterium]|jgi:hypothetical protein|nr:hypothetical protein [Rhodocyclaceae bacterium]MCA3020729.1 hypothetical protein [Rhodocyclaceae bacterium]MCA3025648.1 hypothetical protein [Rhodocyclaceae bacterium]MCA3029327.1 hypothetical protein [Rhodocyclaceae bacterium]MCA3030795.1 hypothetical protein [Rhodocyclaceae bacterium]
MVDQILDTIIPQDEALGLPSAARINFDAYCAQYGIQDLVARYGNLVELTAEAKLGKPFRHLDADERFAIITATSAKNFRLYSSFVIHVMRAYYTHKQVLSQIGSGAVPPFPTGNIIDQGDWDLLEPVYERGPIYRAIEDFS